MANDNAFEPLEADLFMDEDTEALLSGESTEDVLRKAFDEKPAELMESEPEKATDEKEGEAKTENKSRYSKDELLAIFDSIMFEGTYSESVSILKGRFTATLRTRSASESNAINVAIDRQKFSTLLTLQNHQILMTLSYALQEFSVTSSVGNESRMSFAGKKPKDVYEKISKLPEPVIEALSRGLGEFDDKVRAALLEAEQSF